MTQKLVKLAAREALLEAAKAVLRERGYAALSTREVATAAGVPLSQIHYHFGSKQGLVLALFEYLDAQLLERQQALFNDPSLSLADQWDRACTYLDDDLASGYVRVMQELAAAGWADPAVGAVVRKSLEDWIGLVIELARRFEQQYGPLGPFTPEEVGALVSNAFIGAESLVLTGLEKKDVPIRDSLRRIGALIRNLERRNP
ncbi:MAG TPA: TetR/AcrR family transcriptional regulator [Burkholderiales bacterium]|nr:TetR/AcrR family transcriptional regulator [Burkholderiales bacterium]